MLSSYKWELFLNYEGTLLPVRMSRFKGLFV